MQNINCSINVGGSSSVAITSGLTADFNPSIQGSVLRDSLRRVSQFTDVVGSISSTQSTPTNMPTYSNNGGPGNAAYISCNGSQYTSGALLQSTATYTMVIVRRLASGAMSSVNGVGSFQNGTGNTGYGMYDLGTFGSLKGVGAYWPGSAQQAAEWYCAKANQWEIVVSSYSTANPRTYNTLGTFFAPSRTDQTPVTPATGHYIGRVDGGPDKFIGDIARILVYNRQLSDSEVTTICKSLQKQYSLPLPVVYNAGGDSITYGTIGYNGYAGKSLIDLLPTNYFYLDLSAVPSRTSDVVLSNLTTEVIARYQPGVRNLYTLMVGHNDIASGYTQAHLYANISNMLAQTKAVGYINGLLTTLYTTAYSTTITDSINNYIRANYLSMNADDMLDLNAMFPTDPTNTTWYVDGQTHPSEAGHQLIATNLIEPWLITRMAA